MNPPSDDPLQYCRFCFSQFRVEPLLSGAQKDQQLINQISSIIQIKLDPDQASVTAICSMCRTQLKEFQLFRERCSHHDSIVREKVEGIQSSNNDMWFAVETLDDNDDSDEESAAMGKSDPLRNVPGAGSEKQTRENFWGAISQDVGVIPEHIQRALELTGFYRNASLGMISPTTIKQIEQDMPEAIEFVISQESKRTEVLRQYYGSVYCKNPAKFKFLAGEVQTILSITATVQENGIAEYLNKACVSQRVHNQTRRDQLYAAEKPDNADVFAEELVAKIKDYYKQHATSDKGFTDFFSRLPGVEGCDVRQTEDGTIFALLHCFYCKKNLKAFRSNRWNAWQISNFVQHCQHHYRIKYKISRRKRIQGGGNAEDATE
uniref:ZAD domain-containing protein n=1 Tax=Culex tarsalis TaxID=7177 RepID=A0A1Q3EX20_CULTA